MYNNPKYRFYLIIGEDEHLVYPVFNEDIKLDSQKEEGYEFFRTKFEGKLTFVKDDYDKIVEADYETEYKIEIWQRNYTTGTYEFYYRGKFTRTDLKIFEGEGGQGEKVVLSKITTLDKYTKILEGIENEENLIELNPDLTTVNYVNKPLFQFYVENGTKVLCVLGGTWWEVEVEPTDDYSYLRGDCYFQELNTSQTVNGTLIEQRVYMRMLHNNEDLYDSSPNLPAEWGANDYGQIMRGNDITIDSIQGYSMVYWSAIWYNSPNTYIKLNNDSQSGITKYGRYPNSCSGKSGRYYVQQVSENLISFNGSNYYPNLIPVNKSQWGCYSIWFDYVTVISYFNNPDFKGGIFNTDITYLYNYRVSDVIKKLIEILDEDITHESAEEYSQFLYGDGENNIINGDQYTLILTPKSNFIAKDADEPAVRAFITLKDVFDALWGMKKLRWKIDDNNRLIIEHISWFDNGGSYDGTPEIQLDIMDFYNNRARVAHEFQQNNIEYDKPNMAQRFEFEWMDAVSPAFKGYPIIMRGENVQKDLKEEISINKITTDTDYVSTNPVDISKEGFMMFAAKILESNNNLLTGNDSTMSGPNNWLIWPATNYYDVNNTYAGKLYIELANGGDTLMVQPQNFRKGGTYRIRLKARIVSGGSSRKFWLKTGIFEIIDGFPTQLKKEFTVTDLEETIEIDNYVAEIDDWLIIRFGYEQSSCAVIFDNVEVFDVLNYSMETKEAVINNNYYNLQNLDLSWIYLHNNFWKYSLPSELITVNNIDTVADSVKRNKLQELSFPYTEELNSLELIKTSQGNGEIDKISVNLLSRMTIITLRHDTE